MVMVRLVVKVAQGSKTDVWGLVKDTAVVMDVAAVQASVDAAAQVVGQKGMLVNKVVIPHPRSELLNEMI